MEPDFHLSRRIGRDPQALLRVSLHTELLLAGIIVAMQYGVGGFFSKAVLPP